MVATCAGVTSKNLQKRSVQRSTDPINGHHSGLKHQESHSHICGYVFWLLVRNWVSPTKADNALTWDRTVIVATLVVGVETDFPRMIIVEIHEKALKASTTYHFPCLIFMLCKDSGVPIWHCDKLIRATGTLDIGLIRDRASVAAPRRETQVDIPPLGVDLVDDVEQMQGDDPAPPSHTDDAPASPSQATNRAPSSSRVTPPSGVAVLPLVCVPKLEAQIPTLLHHVKPWMQKSIVESEVRMDRRMETIIEQKVQAIHNGPNAFKFRVLARPDPVTNLSSIRTELDSLQANLDAIITPPIDKPEYAPTALANDTVFDALFSDDIAQPEPTRARGKRHHSSHISDTTEDARARKWECQQNEQARRASIINEELRQQRARESIIGASSARPTTEIMTAVGDDVSTTDSAVRLTNSTTDGVVIDDVGLTEVDPSVVLAGSGKPDLPVC
uniref:Integrase core domain containing protein n=1 Tax=Solanum tuberosum TaxID=4113 RepID=M1DEL4_SOLTU